MNPKLVYLLTAVMWVLLYSPVFALETWNFKRTYESRKLIDSPFFLNTTADLNKNGAKELIVADFGRYGDHIEEWKDWKEDLLIYNFMVLEWEKSELKLNWSKQWDMKKIRSSDADRQRYFTAYESRQLIAWPIGDRVIVETIPARLTLEYIKGKYVLHERSDLGMPGKSEALPWQSDSCYERRNWPMECLVGIRDFSGKGQPRILSILEEKIGDKKYKQTIRVRKFEPGFPIEWEMESPQRFAWWTPSAIFYNDRFNWNLSIGLRLPVFRKYQDYWLEGDTGKNYILKALQPNALIDVETYDLPDVHIGATQKKGTYEYWGYHKVDIPRPKQIDFILHLKKGVFLPDHSGFASEVINFPHNEPFLGVGYFDLKDIDNDGLEEVILVEETGKKEFDGHESVAYSNIKDYIRILKWDGKEYQTMWVSPPYTKRGTKFLIEDIKNTGKKQLVVLSPYGTVQIWEKE